MSDISMPIDDELGDVAHLLKVAEEMIAALSPPVYYLPGGENDDRVQAALIRPGALIPIQTPRQILPIHVPLVKLVQKATLVCARVRSRLPR